MMRSIAILITALAFAAGAFAAEPRSGEELIAAMHKKYDGKWYKTLTFVQKTTNYKPDGTSESSTWYEAMSVPGQLRIDFAPIEKGDGILFAGGKIYSFADGKTKGGRTFMHPLLVLGFDVYIQPVAATVDQVKSMGIDLSVISRSKWQGQDVYIVGAKDGDLATPQFWVTKKDLLFVRLFQKGGKDKNIVNETQFNNYVKVKKGWVSAEVQFYSDGKHVTTEEYSDIQTDIPLSSDLWDPEKWMTADRTYYKKK